MQNSTFGGNSVGTLNNGADIAADAGMTVLNSTFVNLAGRLAPHRRTGRRAELLFTTDYTGGGSGCAERPGRLVHRRQQLLQGGRLDLPRHQRCALLTERSAPARPHRLDPRLPAASLGAPPMGDGADCSATDALGAARPLNRLRPRRGGVQRRHHHGPRGGPEHDRARCADAPRIGDDRYGRGGAGLRRCFTFDGTDSDPVAVTDGVAEFALDGLDVGATYSYAAAFSPSGDFEPSGFGPGGLHGAAGAGRGRSALREPRGAEPGMAPECVGPNWNISDSESIHLIAKVVDAPAGTVSIALDAAGTTIVAGPSEVEDGEATFVIPASAFGLGLQQPLHAIYVSDDGDYAGTSPIARSSSCCAPRPSNSRARARPASTATSRRAPSPSP